MLPVADPGTTTMWLPPSASACLARCKAESACAWFTFYPSSGLCATQTACIGGPVMSQVAVTGQVNDQCGSCTMQKCGNSHKEGKLQEVKEILVKW